jgi:hypothetical protein
MRIVFYYAGPRGASYSTYYSNRHVNFFFKKKNRLLCKHKYGKAAIPVLLICRLMVCRFK